MTKHQSDQSLFRIDPTKNMQRFYRLSVQPNLFGGYSLIRNWGRIGSSGQLRIDMFEDELTAELNSARLKQAKIVRGYKLPN